MTIDVAERIGVSRQKVARWRNRFLTGRLSGIERDFPRSGRKPKLTPELERKIVKATLVPPKEGRWSLRRLAEHLGITPYFVNVVWHRHNLPEERAPRGRRPRRSRAPRSRG
ncbi:MAG: helix-turn-helix domain-containing protein [Thermoguttaceae bacterium]|nr:helix-turn-helix domain-containing protein [Thermoguttaceae bacterium]